MKKTLVLCFLTGVLIMQSGCCRWGACRRGACDTCGGGPYAGPCGDDCGSGGGAECGSDCGAPACGAACGGCNSGGDGCCYNGTHCGPVTAVLNLLNCRSFCGPVCGERYYGDWCDSPPNCCHACDCASTTMGASAIGDPFGPAPYVPGVNGSGHSGPGPYMAPPASRTCPHCGAQVRVGNGQAQANYVARRSVAHPQGQAKARPASQRLKASQSRELAQDAQEGQVRVLSRGDHVVKQAQAESDIEDAPVQTARAPRPLAR
jgi:hypothetical protein